MEVGFVGLLEPNDFPVCPYRFQPFFTHTHKYLPIYLPLYWVDLQSCLLHGPAWWPHSCTRCTSVLAFSTVSFYYTIVHHYSFCLFVVCIAFSGLDGRCVVGGLLAGWWCGGCGGGWWWCVVVVFCLPCCCVAVLLLAVALCWLLLSRWVGVVFVGCVVSGWLGRWFLLLCRQGTTVPLTDLQRNRSS